MNPRVQVVFLGPSLPHDDARSVLPHAVLLPPAAMGDVLAAVRTYRPHAIGLVDGSFIGTMSVFHKELLYAMEQGSWVLGAASMGALRAADCAAYGMVGVGEIFRGYADGTIDDDDEVALVHADAEHGFRALSDAMVTIRATLRAARMAGIIDEGIEAALAERQKARWFPDRSLAGVAGDAVDLDLSEAAVQDLAAFMRAHVVDPKRADALALLRAMAALPDHGPDSPAQTVISPYFAATLARDAPVPARDGSSITPDRLRRWAILNEPEAAQALARVRERRVLARLSTLLMGPPSAEDLRRARAKVRAQLRQQTPTADGLSVRPAPGPAVADRGDPEEDLQREFRDELDLDERAARELIVTEAVIDRLLSCFIAHPGQSLGTTAFLNQLRLTGDYQRIRDAAADAHAAARQADLADCSPRDIVIAFAQLTGWAPPEDLDAYIAEHQLGDPQELLLVMSIAVRAARARGVDIARDLTPSQSVTEPHLHPARPRPSRGQ